MTAVDVKIGEDWHFDLSDWSVTGYSTPLIAGDMTGGAATLSFTLPETADSRMLQGKQVLLRDPHSGDLAGSLALGGGNGVNATTTGVSNLSKLNVRRVADAYSGTLRGAILYYMGLCGVTQGVMISTLIASRTVNYIGWEGNVLDRIKDLCVAQQMSISLIGDKYVFRAVTGAGGLPPLISVDSFADYTWQGNESGLAQNVEVAWYKTEAPKAQLVYPAGGWREDLPVLQVDAGETVEYEIDLAPDADVEGSYGMSATTIAQPVPVISVPREYAGASSVYAVSGKDGLPLPPEQWADGGGSMSLELLDGGSRIRVTLVGANIEGYGPFQISMTSGTSEDYSSLRIYGTGMLYQRSVLRMATGLDADRAPEEVAPIVETPFLTSKNAAWTAAANLLSKHVSTFYTISGSIGQVRTLEHTPQTFFDGGTVEQDPAVQSFGNLEGACFIAEGLVFRIRQVTYTPNGATFQAEQHASQQLLALGFGLQGIYSQTAAQFDAFYPAGITAQQLSARPLIGVEQPLPPATATFPSPLMYPSPELYPGA